MDNLKNKERKIIITGLDEINKFDVVDTLLKLDNSFMYAPIFTTDKSVINDKYYYLDTKRANLSYKNNAVFYIFTEQYNSHGVTLEDFIKNNVIIANIREYNNISDKFFNNYDILTVWIDSKFICLSALNNYKYELKFLIDRINEHKYLYFTNNNPMNIAKTIISYWYADEDNKRKILDENS